MVLGGFGHWVESWALVLRWVLAPLASEMTICRIQVGCRDQRMTEGGQYGKSLEVRMKARWLGFVVQDRVDEWQQCE